jgi:hypothetical protein
MKKIWFILLFCILSCHPADPSIITIHRNYGLPTVTVIVKGKPVEMIMDTGGAVTILDDDLARELGIIPSGESMELRGYGGSRSLLQSEELTLQLGQTQINADTYISDIDNVLNNKQVKGILGIKHLENATIDLKKNTITFE